MKRTGNLYGQICDPDNLRFAFIKAKRGKETKPGVYKYAKHINENLNLLRQQLLTGNFDLGDYHFFTIFEPKERLICAAPFPDRVLHHAIINVCHPVFERYQVCHSYATRFGKGQYKALEYARKNQKKFKWFCKLDIRKYFNSISHQKLIELLNHRFKDDRLLHLLIKIIHSYKSSDGKGLPIGNLTSQYFANFFLGAADHYLLEKIQIPAYVRYMDDMVFWHNDKKALVEKYRELVCFIEGYLDLEVKPECLNRSLNGLTFLGYVVFPDKVRFTKQSKQRFFKKFYQYEKMLNNEFWTQKEFANHVMPLVAFTQHANAHGLRLKQIAKTEAGHRAPTALIGAVAGTTVPTTAGLPIATTTARATATTI